MEQYLPSEEPQQTSERQYKEGTSFGHAGGATLQQEEAPPPPGPPPPDLLFERQQQAHLAAQKEKLKINYGWPWHQGYLPIIAPPPKITRWGNSENNVAQMEERSIQTVPHYCATPYYPVEGEYKIKDPVTEQMLMFIEGPSAEQTGFLVPGVIVEAAWKHVVDAAGHNTKDIWHAAIIRDVLRTEVPHTQIVILKYEVVFCRYGTIGTLKSDDIRVLLGREDHVQEWRNYAATQSQWLSTNSNTARDSEQLKESTSNVPKVTKSTPEPPSQGGWTTVSVRQVTEEEENQAEKSKDKHLDRLNRYAAGEENVDIATDTDKEENKKDGGDAEDDDDGYEDVTKAFNPFGGNTYRGFKVDEEMEDHRFTESSSGKQDSQEQPTAGNGEEESGCESTQFNLFLLPGMINLRLLANCVCSVFVWMQK